MARLITHVNFSQMYLLKLTITCIYMFRRLNIFNIENTYFKIFHCKKKNLKKLSIQKTKKIVQNGNYKSG